MFFDKQEKQKQTILELIKCSGDYQRTFFTPFESFSEAKYNVKAVFAWPFINLGLALYNLIGTCFGLIAGLANVAIGAITFDLDELKTGGSSLIASATSAVNTLYHLVSIATDTLATLFRLVTHFLSTVVFGVYKAAQAIFSCCDLSSTAPSI